MYNVYSIILRWQGEGPIAYFCWILDIHHVHQLPVLRIRTQHEIHLQPNSDAQQQESQARLSLLSWGYQKAPATYLERISAVVRERSLEMRLMGVGTSACTESSAWSRGSLATTKRTSTGPPVTSTRIERIRSMKRPSRWALANVVGTPTTNMLSSKESAAVP